MVWVVRFHNHLREINYAENKNQETSSIFTLQRESTDNNTEVETEKRVTQWRGENHSEEKETEQKALATSCSCGEGRAAAVL